MVENCEKWLKTVKGKKIVKNIKNCEKVFKTVKNCEKPSLFLKNIVEKLWKTGEKG